jgi:hypothetical protein
MELVISILRGVRELASSNTSRLPQRLIYAVLNKNRQLDPNTLCIFNDLPVTKYGIDLGPGDFFCIRTQESQPLLLLQRVCTR